MMNRPDELHEDGVSAYNSGRFGHAEALIRKAIELDGDNPHFHINLASTLIAQKRHAPALMSLSKAIQLDPSIETAHYLKGIVLQNMGEITGALASAGIALALQPDSAKSLLLRGNLHASLGNTQSAMADYRAAITLDEQDPTAHFNLACSLSECGRLDEALAEYDECLRLYPEFVEAMCNKANALRDLMRLNESLATYHLALEIAPTAPHLQWNLALLQLQLGNYSEGWKNYEYRLQDSASSSCLPNTSSPRWVGQEPLEGRSILVVGEQGLGDMIQFSRYVPELTKLGARVTLQVPATLVKLFGSLAKGLTVIPISEPPPETDFYCMLMSLPSIFKTDTNSIPSGKTPYLYPTGTLPDTWPKASKTTRPRIGLVTQGNPSNPRDAQRRISLDAIASMLPETADYFLLHKHPSKEELEALKEAPHIKLACQDVIDFNDTASTCMHLDLVITVDTALAHLGGALGINTWVMVPFASDWRWLTQRIESPWYSSVRLFRQDRPNQWDQVLKEVVSELDEFISRHPSNTHSNSV